MNELGRLETFVRAWREFQRVDADLDAIFDKYRRGVGAPDDPSQAGGTMTQADSAEVARLQAEIAQLAPMLDAMPLPTSTPIAQPTAKEVIQAYRLAGWPQWKIDRKLTGERLAQLDRRLGLLLIRHGVDRYAVLTRDQIAAMQIAERDRQELLEVQGEWARVGADVERLSRMVESKSGRTAAGPDVVAAWCRRVSKAEAFCHMCAALQELEGAPVAHARMTPDELEPLFASDVEQSMARIALEVAPADATLRQLGFVPQSADGPDLRWEGTEWDMTMLVGAGPSRKGHWALTGWYKVAGEWQQQNAEVAAHGQRGKVAATLLSMWRQAFGRAVRPPGALDLGRIFEQQRERFGRPDMSLPRLELDGPAFRATRQRLQRRFGKDAAAVASLAVSDGALRVSVAGSTFTVPAGGGFGLGCDVALGDLIGIPPSCLRGGVIRMERGWSVLTIDWYCIRIDAGAELRSSYRPQ